MIWAEAQKQQVDKNKSNLVNYLLKWKKKVFAAIESKIHKS